MTIKQAAQTALDCQDACNLSGVVSSFKAIVHEVLWPEARRLNQGTDWVNKHPIVTLFLDKLDDLNGRHIAGGRAWFGEGNAHDQVRKLAEDLENDTAKASEQKCYLCGHVIGDAAYKVDEVGLVKHASTDLCRDLDHGWVGVDPGGAEGDKTVTRVVEDPQ